MENIINLLEIIKEETKDINRILFYDYIEIEKKAAKEEFLKEVFIKISENYEWDSNRFIENNYNRLLIDTDFSKMIPFSEFINHLIETIPVEYQKVLETTFSNFEKTIIYKFDFEIVKIIYPFFDNIFFIETQEHYIVFSLGYVD